MRLFGADPEELRLTYRKLYETEMQLGLLKHDLENREAQVASLDSAVKGLQKENAELKEAALKARQEMEAARNQVSPFANWPRALVDQIDFERMGIKEPE